MWIVVGLVLAACGDDTGTPSTRNLRGYWSWEDDKTQTVFAFVAPEGRDQVYVQPEVTLPPDKDISVVWLGTIVDMVLDDNQIATYEVKDDALIQTVIGDVLAPPGTMYSTKILAFDESSMTLESKNDPSGMRTYTKASRCQNQNRLGWQIAGMADLSSAQNRHASIAIDAEGHVHSIVNGSYQFQGDGCHWIVSAFVPGGTGLTAIALRGDEVHTVIEAGSSLIHAWRTTPDAPWQTEPLPPSAAVTPIYNVALFVAGTELVAAASHSDGVFELYRQGAAGWKSVTLAGVIDHRAEDIAMGPGGDIAVLSLDKLRRIRGTAVEEIALPRPHFDNSVNGGVTIDKQGRIHAAWAYAIVSSAGFVSGARSVYGVYDGAWTLYELGVAIYPRPVLGPNDEMRVISAGLKAGIPAFTLTEIAADGTLTSERITGEPAFASGPVDSSVRMAAAAGPDGTVATCWSGRIVYVKHPQRLRPPRTAMFTARITGTGRVYTDDGMLDCTATCSVPVTVGTRLRVKMTPGPGLKGYDSVCGTDAHEVEGYCWHDMVIGQDNLLATEILHPFFFTP